MEAKQYTKRRWKPSVVGALCVLGSVFFGCATVQRSAPVPKNGQVQSSGADSSSPMGPMPAPPGAAQEGVSSEPFGPPQASVAPAYGPEPVKIRPIVLVMSSGVVKGFAHSGVIEALTLAKVPIGAVLGAEMGALIGAIYANDGNVNHLQWEMTKLKEDLFESERGLFPSHKLEGQLTRFFGKKDLGESRIPCVIALQIKPSRELELVHRGPAKQALRSAIAFPELLGPGEWRGVPAISARKSLRSLIREARSLGIGPVVVIDVSHDQGKGLNPTEADLVVRPELRGVSDFDFKMRTEAAFRGKRAVMDRLKEILDLVGMRQGDE